MTSTPFNKPETNGKQPVIQSQATDNKPLFGMAGPFPAWDILPPVTVPNIRIKKKN